jgi:hypothetical protein
MAKQNVELDLDEELQILLFWAQGKEISRKFSVEKLRAIPELEKAIEAISYLPASIGWDDEISPGRSKRARSMPAGSKKR